MRRIHRGVAVAILIALVIAVLFMGYKPAASAGTPAAKPATDPKTSYIWPNPNFVSWDLDHPALPKVESVAACMQKYGPDDWRTWRAQYFEKRLTLPDDPYRIEHSSFADIINRGAECNVWTGYHVGMFGMKPENFVLTMWPGVGCRSQTAGSAFLHPGESSTIWSSFSSETLIRVHRGSGEFYLADHWIPVTRGDMLYAPPNCPHGFRVPAGNKEDMVAIIYITPPAIGDYISAGMLVPDVSEAAKKAGLAAVWHWKHPEEFGPFGTPITPVRLQ